MSNNRSGTSRIDYARRAVELLLRDSLRPTDSIAVSTFNREGRVLTPLCKLSELDEAACLSQVQELTPGGGTTLGAGMDVGRSVFDTTGACGGATTRRILM